MTTVMDLMDDLLVEIFRKLPAVSIPICKSVCKAWFNLLSDRSLRTRLPETMSGLYLDCVMFCSYPTGFTPTRQSHKDNNHHQHVTFDYIPNSKTVRIMHVSDGLLLCNYTTTTTLFVANPATETYELLPLIPESISFDDNFHHNVVLGFDRSSKGNDSYVVLANLDRRIRTINHFTYVFQRRTGEWIPFDYVNVQQERHFVLASSLSVLQKVCYIDGVFYFFPVSISNEEEYFVVAVDVDKELARAIRIPFGIKDRELYEYCLGKKSDGCLLFGGFGTLEYPTRSSEEEEDGKQVDPMACIKSVQFHMWMLDYGAENWELKFSIDMRNLSPDDLGIDDLGFDVLGIDFCALLLFKMVAFDPDYEVVFFRVGFTDIFAFSMRSNKITKVCDDACLYGKFFVHTPLWVDVFANPIKDH